MPRGVSGRGGRAGNRRGAGVKGCLISIGQGFLGVLGSATIGELVFTGTTAISTALPIETTVFRLKLPEEIRTPWMRRLLAIWVDKSGTRRFPSRGEIGPRDIKAFLKHVSVLTVVEGGSDFEFRLAGDALVQSYGGEFKTKRLSVVLGNAELFAHFRRRIVVERAPCIYEIGFARGDQSVFYREQLALPLGEDGNIVDHVLAAGVDLPDWSGPTELP